MVEAPTVAGSEAAANIGSGHPTIGSSKIKNFEDQKL